MIDPATDAQSPILIPVQVNDQWINVAAGSNILELLRCLEIETLGVAVERNLVIVPQAEFATTQLETNDVFEVVTLRGGG